MKKKVKKCNGCDITKPVSKFFLRRKKKWVISEGIYKTYVFPMNVCKDCSRIQLRSLKLAINEDGSTNWSGVLQNIRKKCKQHDIRYDLNLGEFRIWFSKQKDECHYCKLSLEESRKIMPELKRLGEYSFSKFHLDCRRFEIDRKDNDYSIGYTFDNICLACHVCNTTKGDKFSYKEFIKYARENISPRLKKMI